MTTTVTIRVNGRYRTTVKQTKVDGTQLPDVVIDGAYTGSKNPSGEMEFNVGHPATSIFEIIEEYIPQEGAINPNAERAPRDNLTTRTEAGKARDDQLAEEGRVVDERRAKEAQKRDENVKREAEQHEKDRRMAQETADRDRAAAKRLADQHSEAQKKQADGGASGLSANRSGFEGTRSQAKAG